LWRACLDHGENHEPGKSVHRLIEERQYVDLGNGIKNTLYQQTGL
jgi:hypothetical protein